VIITAHWDHLGRDTMHLRGDQISNGALDNASGTAALLEIAGAMGRLLERAPRSMLFIALTAEEQGPLGAKWYASQPLYPLHKTVANINLDGINQWSRTRDMTVIGFGNNSSMMCCAQLWNVTVARSLPTRSRKRGASFAAITLSLRTRACPRCTPGRDPISWINPPTRPAQA